MSGIAGPVYLEGMARPDGGALLDPEAAKEWLSAWKGRIDELAAATGAMSERVQALRVTVTDPSGLAEVTVDSAGTLVDLRLGERMYQLAPEVVARTILDTVAEAKAEMAVRAQAVITETLGPDSVAGQEIARRLGEQLRGPDQPDEGDGAAR